MAHERRRLDRQPATTRSRSYAAPAASDSAAQRVKSLAALDATVLRGRRGGLDPLEQELFMTLYRGVVDGRLAR